MQAVFLTLVWIVCYWFCLPVYAIGEPPIINLPKSTIERAIDFHINSSPDVIPRRLDDFEVATLAAKLLRHLNCMLKKNQTLVGWASRPP